MTTTTQTTWAKAQFPRGLDYYYTAIDESYSLYAEYDESAERFGYGVISNDAITNNEWNDSLYYGWGCAGDSVENLEELFAIDIAAFLKNKSGLIAKQVWGSQYPGGRKEGLSPEEFAAEREAFIADFTMRYA